MTRTDTLATYTVDANGTITSPGKFEGTPIYTPHFWELALEGEGDNVYDSSIGKYVNIIEVDQWDRAEYPEIDQDHTEFVQVWEDDQGFVHLDCIEAPLDQG